MKSKRTKAVAIPSEVKYKVWKRQHGKSIFSGTLIDPCHCCCHYIRRSHGGLGIEENIIGLTPLEHQIFDGNVIGSKKEDREMIRRRARKHLMNHYPGWSEDKLKWKK